MIFLKALGKLVGFKQERSVCMALQRKLAIYEVLHVYGDILESQASFPTLCHGLPSGLAAAHYEKCVTYKESGESKGCSLSF